MDFLSRDRQRQAVEELARRSGEAQVRVALKAVESARQAAAAGSAADRAAHVGYHLIDPGRARSRGRRRVPAAAARRGRAGSCCATPSPLYLGRHRASLTGVLVAAAVRYAPVAGGGGALARSASPLLALAPGERSRDRAASSAWSPGDRPPRRLPRLDFSDRRPGRRAHDGHRADDADQRSTASTALLEHLEVLALGNLDPRIHFAILSDFADASTRDAPDDAAILERGACRASRR